MVNASRAGATVLAGVADAGVAGVGARIVVLTSGPRGVVCHGTEIVSTAEQVEKCKTRELDLGGNSVGELVFVETPGLLPRKPSQQRESAIKELTERREK